jgi:putative membrane protein
MLFIGGLLTLAFVLRSAPAAAELRRLRRWNLLVTTPALLLVWGVGFHLAIEAGWLASLWLKLKLGCVVALTLVHAWQTHSLMRAGRGGPMRGTPGWLPLLIFMLLAAIFFLVATKPL